VTDDEAGQTPLEVDAPGNLLTRRLPVAAIRSALDLLSRRERRLLILAALIQMSLSILDLIGIALIGMIAALAVSGVNPTTLPPWIADIIDTLGLQGLTISQLAGLLGAAAVVVFVTKTLASAYLSRRIIHFLANQQAKVSSRLAGQLLKRPLLDVQRFSTPEVLYALGPGTSAAIVGILGSVVAAAAELFLFAIVAVSLFLVDPGLTLATFLLFGGIVFILQVWLGRLSARNGRIVAESAIGTTSAVQEALSTYRETTVLNRRDLYIDRYQGLVGRTARAAASNQYILEVPKYILESALVLGGFTLAIVQFLTKDLTAAATTVALFLTAGFRVIPALLRLQAAGINIRNASEGARPTFRLSAFLTETSRQGSSDEPATDAAVTASWIRDRIAAGHGDFEASVVVGHVTLRYPGTDKPALSDISLSAAPGTSIALVGSTGAGKSTLADLILGVLAPDEGTVLVSGLPPREAISRWPGAMSYVPQTVALVDGSVRQNVALGLPDEAIDDTLVWHALERAHLAAFLRESREGIDTLIGERGIRLSGGQRQRLGIARALYTQPKLLVLDEATSALDAETEVSIVETLAALEGEVTTITVAHRLATVRAVDNLIYMKHGRVVQAGSFDTVRMKVPDFERQASLLGL
jgi:ABC-type multidrug transport system fused ATPase/permease subunit